MQHYVLPVEVLLETMAGSQATVTLRSHLVALPEAWDEECIVDLVIVHGTLHTCTISTVEGHLLLQQEAAFQMLLRVGATEWTLLPASSSPLPPHRPGQPASMSQQTSPDWKVVAPLSPELLTALSRRHKQVLLLVGGGKRPEEIARLLQLSLPDVERILEELQQRQLIYSLTFERNRR